MFSIDEVTTFDVVSSYWTLGPCKVTLQTSRLTVDRGHDMRCREELGTREYEGLGPCYSSRRMWSCGGERRELYEALGQVRRGKHNEALGPFQRRSRQDLSCRMEAGLGPFIIIEDDWWALGRMVVSRGPHDTHCREGDHTATCITQRTTTHVRAVHPREL